MSSDFDKVLGQWIEDNGTEQAMMLARLKLAIDKLKPLGVTTIVVEYDGSGDSGDIQDVQYYKGDGLLCQRWHEDLFPREIDDEISVICDALCPAGYENDDGGHGTFTINVKTGEIEHDSYYRETISHCNEEAEQFTLPTDAEMVVLALRNNGID